MTDHRQHYADRLVDLALSERVGGETPSDLSERILATMQESAQEPVQPARRAAHTRTSTPARLTCAVSVGLLAAAIAFALWTPPVDPSSLAKTYTREDLPKLVERFNRLIDQQRYEEAALIAERTQQIAPEDVVVKSLNEKAKFALWMDENSERIDSEFARGLLLTENVASNPFDDGAPIVYPDASVWQELTIRRKKFAAVGAADANFDELIDLITSTVKPDTWKDVGGPGAIDSFRGNLSLVVKQRQSLGAPNVVMHNGQSLYKVSNNRLDLRFSQRSFGSNMPQFGGFDANEQAPLLAGAGVQVNRLPTLVEKGFIPGFFDVDNAGDGVPDAQIVEAWAFHDRREAEIPGSAEEYTPIHENAFLPVRGPAAVSTFSVDVDTASYSNVRRMLKSGALPHPDAVRIEEFVNYFSYDYAPPAGDTPFSASMELAGCPWNEKHQLLRVALKGKEIPPQERPAANLVFLLDVSGSMDEYNKLPLLKQAMKLLIGELRKDDRVTIVVYAGEAGLALDTTAGDQTIKLHDAIDALHADGSTNGSAGIQLAYEKAIANFIKGGINRVILATDGDLNVGITADDALVEFIKDKAASNVFLSVLGFGTGNLKDGKLEKLADNGNGNYAYLDNLKEARKVLVEQIGGSLIAIAKDVKLQLEFNPAQVRAYRLIGYENRILAAEDFDDDAKDAGEIGAGHTVTALYELVPVGSKEEIPGIDDAGSEEPPLKYQRTSESSDESDSSPDAGKPGAAKPKAVKLTKAAESGELLTLALRYKRPDGDVSTKLEFTLPAESKAFNKASRDFQFAASVASFAMLLRHSKHAGSASFAAVEEIATAALGDDQEGRRAEFVDLVRVAEGLSKK